MMIRSILFTCCLFFLLAATKVQAHAPCLVLSPAQGIQAEQVVAPLPPVQQAQASLSISADAISACDSCSDSHASCCWASLPREAQASLLSRCCHVPQYLPSAWPSTAPGLWLPPPIL